MSAPPELTEAMLCGLLAVAIAQAWPAVLALLGAVR
jgi:hypothetical protein